MKNVTCLFILAIFVLLSCDKNKPETTDSLSILKVDYGGCFLSHPKSVETKSSLYKDSIYYTIDNSALNLHIDMASNCCSNLKDTTLIKDGEATILIEDVSKTACYCLCLFKFNYSFNNFYRKNTSFKVYLKGINEDYYSLWKEIEFDIAKD